MNASMQMPATPQHDLVAMTAALRGVLMQRVEQGIQASGLKNYLLYLLAKRLVLAGPQTVAVLSGQLRQRAHDVEENLLLMQEQGMAVCERDEWRITDAGRRALNAANDSGGRVLVDIRNAIGGEACDQLVAGMREAVAALRAAA